MIGLNAGLVDDICWVSFEEVVAFSRLRKQFQCMLMPAVAAAATYTGLSAGGSSLHKILQVSGG
jgi:hypothetical protein